jgi:hypothetical protein
LSTWDNNIPQDGSIIMLKAMKTLSCYVSVSGPEDLLGQLGQQAIWTREGRGTVHVWTVPAGTISTPLVGVPMTCIIG